jgi:hypothetical protein
MWILKWKRKTAVWTVSCWDVLVVAFTIDTKEHPGELPFAKAKLLRSIVYALPAVPVAAVAAPQMTVVLSTERKVTDAQAHARQIICQRS